MFFRLASENEAKSRMYDKIIRIVYQVDVSSSALFTISIIEYQLLFNYTPSVIGQTAVNPNIDDNRCLQRCLILASEGGHKIIANCKIGDATVTTSGGNNPTSTRYSE